MDKEDIHLSDISRILFGDASPIFMLEIFIRTLIMYTLLLFMIRWLGKRMAGQLTLTEMAVMIMLGAIVSAPMQMPEKGILQGSMILLGTVLLQRGLTLIAVKRKKFEVLSQGEASVLVKDGILQLKEMNETRISHQQVFAKLRAHNVYNLRQVKRMYIEAGGIFSIYKSDDEGAGLSLYPPDDSVIADRQQRAGRKACSNCGFVVGSDERPCPVCHSSQWVNAVVVKNDK